jgi:hypothetical protein
MNAADSINATDRDLLRRLAIIAAFVFAFTWAFAKLERTYSQKFLNITGSAQWIWAPHRMSDRIPLTFFATRDFTLPENRIYAHLKVAGDPEYDVWVNGTLVGMRRLDPDERALDKYDISALVKTGRNRIVIAVRTPEGVGGLLASIDIHPEIANYVVTDGAWKIYRSWTPELLARDVPSLALGPVLIGKPPIGRWNYLTITEQELAKPAEHVVQPRETFEQIGFVPTIQTVSGVAVAGKARERATVFDFGPAMRGRIRVTAAPSLVGSQVLNVRFANFREELGTAEWAVRPLVLAHNETTIETPERHEFRYVMVFGGRNVRAYVLN